MQGPVADDAAALALVRAAQRGRQDAMRELYRHYATPVRRCVSRVVRDEHEAEDVTHEVFIKLMTALNQFEPRGRPFRAWVLRVARNAALDYVRSARRPVLDADPVEDELIDARAGDTLGLDRREDLVTALRELTDEQRAVVVLRHLVGLSPSEVATRLGRSCASVHSLDHRARESLRRDLSRSAAAPAVVRAA